MWGEGQLRGALLPSPAIPCHPLPASSCITPQTAHCPGTALYVKPKNHPALLRIPLSELPSLSERIFIEIL